ncbi:hypothetical protein BSPWISOXPB_7384 [uncultured Gammaproteobacteria bacterium]|nr:hypothetical protein BSPWISOXPB_7384 [uncultured Gammaproteobacteria bacterium]
MKLWMSSETGITEKLIPNRRRPKQLPKKH